MGFWQAFGRGVIKVLVCLLSGFGVGFYFVGKNPDWDRPGPPPGVMEALAFGFLTAAGMLLLLFVVPWLWWKPSVPPAPRSRE